MAKILKLLVFSMFLLACTEKPTTEFTNTQQFSKELDQLQSFFQIPGLAVVVQKEDSVIFEAYQGFADIEQQLPVQKNTKFPIASITKVFSGVLLQQLAEKKAVDLESPIDSFLVTPTFGDSIKIKHVLSHTSQGNVGQQFYYSYRFGSLTPVIEKASGTSFASAIEDAIFKPLDLTQSGFLLDSSSVDTTTAKPYNFEGESNLGQYEYGISAAAGIVSTAGDLIKFSSALDSEVLLKNDSKEKMFAPYSPNLPYGLGVFSQEIEGMQVVWAYGQYDSFSSLFIKVPEQNLNLVMLANSNLMSDPARLINGDLLSSLFAISFLKNYVLDYSNLPLLKAEKTPELPPGMASFQKKKLLAEALAQSYMARFDSTALEKSKKLLRHVFKQYPNYLAESDLNLLHTLCFLKTVHFYKELGPFTEFDTKIESIANTLLEKDPKNPYVHVNMGFYYDEKGDSEKARFHYNAILKAKNFSPFWYTTEAKNWLAKHP